MIVPSNLPLSIEKIDPQGFIFIRYANEIFLFINIGVFLIDNNETIYVYLLKNANPHILRGV